MTNRRDTMAEERLFLIPRKSNEPVPARLEQPAWVSRPRGTPVDKLPPQQTSAGWTPPLWPEDLDHERALTAHARRIQGGSLVVTSLGEQQ